MKKFILGTMIAAAAIFTACSDDDDSSTTSCDVSLSITGLGDSHLVCIEAAEADKLKNVCSDINSSHTENGVTISYKGKVGSGCPGKAVKTCNGTRDGYSFTAYFYDESSASHSCEELAAKYLQ